MKRLAAITLHACAALVTRPALADADIFVMGEGARLGAPDAERTRDVDLEALRGETTAFQIVVDAGPDRTVSVHARPFRQETTGVELEVDVFLQHFVHVGGRSRNDRIGGSLAFTDGARPILPGLRGDIPDALVPIAIAERARVYPRRTTARAPAAFWFDVFVPESASAGRYEGAIDVVVDGVLARTVDAWLRVDEDTLPYRGAPAFAFYDFDALRARFDDPIAAERQTVQTLHAHHLDATAQIVSTEQIRRTEGALTGAWFDDAFGYRGPGRQVPPEVVALGAYGSLGAPSPEGASLVRTLASTLPRQPRDLFVYAVDEQCDSPYGAGWKALLTARRGILVGHTCHEDPVGQKVDLVMMPATAYSPARARVAREAGKRVFAYNGQLPFAGPMMLDVPVTSLTVNGWIAARYDVDRWFYWETTFWHDGNRGGLGPRDVFVDAETFHNADGDVALYDGLLLFPGRSRDFPASDFGADVVFPSIRLKSLRRGIQDAALLQLAARADADATQSVLDRVVGAAFDETRSQRGPRFELSAPALARARAELRRILRARHPFSPDDASDADAAATLKGAGRALLCGAGSFLVAILIVRMANRKRPG